LISALTGTLLQSDQQCVKFSGKKIW
jgi:hypothetical protein